MDLTFSYSNNENPSLDRVNVKIRKGMKTVILGANGAGKSTLFYHFNGIYRPCYGEVLFNGEPISYRKKALRSLRSRVSVVLQNPDDQIFGQTVESDVAYGPSNLGLPADEVRRRVDSALIMVGLEGLRNRDTMQLSYGQRKRLALAGALAMEPEVLVMDEPTAGLDPQMALEIMELAEQLHHNGTTVVLSTHDVDLAYAWADEIHVLRHGSLIYSGTSEGFYRDPVQVYMTGLMPPSMFVINENLADQRGIPVFPYPRTETQLVSKLVSGPKGTLYIMPVTEMMDTDTLNPVLERHELTSIGVFGMMARKLLYENGLPADFLFNGFESCANECLLGRNALIICDVDCVELLEGRISGLRAFGSNIPYKVINP
ncbi:MAG: energy-coupling factor ABC transporter ATP-binding protein [Candidatus Methanomethylophilaceae archaeon]